MSSKAYFNDINSIIIKQLTAAVESIRAALAWLTDQDIIHQLELKAREGVDVLIVINDDEINNYSRSTALKNLKTAGAKIFLVEQEASNLMHHKFCLIDRSTLITGSYNWTYNALSNTENIVVIKGEQNLIDQYEREFDRILNAIRLRTKSKILRPLFENIDIHDSGIINQYFTEKIDRFLWRFCMRYELEKNLENYLYNRLKEECESTVIKVNDETMIMTLVISGKFQFNRFENYFDTPIEVYNEDEFNEEEIIGEEDIDDEKESEDSIDHLINFNDENDIMETRRVIEPNLSDLPQLSILLETDPYFDTFKEYKKRLRLKQSRINDDSATSLIEEGYFSDNLDFNDSVRYYLKNNLLETCCSSEFNLLKVGSLEVNAYCDFAYYDIDNNEINLKDELLRVNANLFISIRNCSYNSEKIKIKPFKRYLVSTLNQEHLKLNFLEFCIEKINFLTIYPYDLKYYWDSVYDPKEDLNKYQYNAFVILNQIKYKFAHPLLYQ
jgi:hypothetical protein